MIEKMHPHYALNTPASIYDEEALTAIELAGRTAKKTNEVIEEVNKVRKDTDDFIDKTENKTIPDMVKKEFSENTENGVFDEMIDTYAGELTKRIDNLVSNIPAGGTTADAEVVDGRVGSNGKTYKNLGTAIREQTSVNGKPIRDIYLKQSTNLFNASEQSDDNQSPYFWSDGKPYTENESFTNIFDCTEKIYLESNETYTIGFVPAIDGVDVPWFTAGTGIMFFDSANNYIGKCQTRTFTTPENCVYIRFNYNTGSVNLVKLQQACVIAKGETLPATYEKYYCYMLDSEVEQNSNDIELLKGAIGIASPNLYNPSEQNANTIDPHYYYDGAPYSTNQFDVSYNCTAPIKVDGYKTYTIGLVPAVNTWVKPWYTTEHGLFFYKADGTYLGKTNLNTFTTPVGTDYIRFNYCIGQGVTLDKLNAHCVLVEGEYLPAEYIQYGSVTISNTKPLFYRANDGIGSIWVYSKLNHANDVVCNLVKNGGNNIFDIDSFGLVENTTGTVIEKAPHGYIIGSSGDWHAPFIVRAVNNADGDAISSKHFTGGNHDYTNSESGSTATGRTTSLKFFADGRQCWGSGYANHIRIEWANRVQGYNTKKADGSGREILEERHVLTFDGYKWESYVELEPLEDIVIETYYGLQCNIPLNTFPYIRYIDGGNRAKIANGSDNHCANHDAGTVQAYGNLYRLIMEIDTTFDLGKREFYPYEDALFNRSYGKAYANIIKDTEMKAGEVYALRGSYILKPA